MGAPEYRRSWWERNWKVALPAGLAILALAVTAYFVFRHWQERQRIDQFLALLSAKDYPAAYAFWGCTVQKPCRDYNYQRFLEEWGPQGEYSEPGRFRKIQTQHCADGIIQELHYGESIEYLYVDSATKTLTHSPWEVCVTRIPTGLVRGAGL